MFVMLWVLIMKMRFFYGVNIIRLYFRWMFIIWILFVVGRFLLLWLIFLWLMLLWEVKLGFELVGMFMGLVVSFIIEGLYRFIYWGYLGMMLRIIVGMGIGLRLWLWGWRIIIFGCCWGRVMWVIMDDYLDFYFFVVWMGLIEGNSLILVFCWWCYWGSILCGLNSFGWWICIIIVSGLLIVFMLILWVRVVGV